MGKAQIIAVIDCVGSSLEKDKYGEHSANQRITAALEQAQQAMLDADPKLYRAAAAAGDSILLIGGEDAAEIYKAAIIIQAYFCALPYNRIPLKIALGHGEFETFNAGEFRDHRGWEIDFCYRLLDVCPRAGIVVSPPFELLVRDTRLGDRLIELQATFKGFHGKRTYFESNGSYQIPAGERQRAPHRRKWDPPGIRKPIPDWFWGAFAAVVIYTMVFGMAFFVRKM